MHNPTASRLVALAAAACLAAPLASMAAVVTFDSDPANHTATPFSSGGLHFTNSGSATFVWNGPGYGADNGTNSLISGFSDSVTITKDGGGTFSLLGFDAGLSWYTTLATLTLSVGSESIVLDPTYQTFNFSAFTNVSSVTVSYAPIDGYFAVDNIRWTDEIGRASCRERV